MQELVQKFKNIEITTDFLKMLVVSAIVASLFLSYLYFAGIPSTRARNIHNEGVRLYEQKHYEEASMKFKESLEIWYTSETQDFFDKAKEKAQTN